MVRKAFNAVAQVGLGLYAGNYIGGGLDSLIPASLNGDFAPMAVGTAALLGVSTAIVLAIAAVSPETLKKKTVYNEGFEPNKLKHTLAPWAVAGGVLSATMVATGNTTIADPTLFDIVKAAIAMAPLTAVANLGDLGRQAMNRAKPTPQI